MAVKYQRRRGTLLEWVRRFNKAIFNRLILTFAGRHVYAVVHHVGRRSGHAYTTPVVAVPIADGFIIPLTFVPSWGRPLVRVLQISQFLKVYRRVTR